MQQSGRVEGEFLHYHLFLKLRWNEGLCRCRRPLPHCLIEGSYCGSVGNKARDIAIGNSPLLCVPPPRIAGALKRSTLRFPSTPTRNSFRILAKPIHNRGDIIPDDSPGHRCANPKRVHSERRVYVSRKLPPPRTYTKLMSMI